MTRLYLLLVGFVCLTTISVSVSFAADYDQVWLESWEDQFGNVHGASSWCGSTPGDNGYFNGWGQSWRWDQEARAYYPATSDTVLIPGGKSLYIASQNGVYAHAKQLTIENGAALTIDTELTLGSIDAQIINHGSLTMPRGTLNLRGDTLITGSSFMQMYHSGSAYPVIAMEEPNAPTLTIDSGVGLEGAGIIGLKVDYWYGRYHFNIVNNGTIRALDQESYELSIDTSPETCVTNNGIIEADDGGILRLYGFYDNTNGIIQAGDGGYVILEGHAGGGAGPGQVLGGTLKTIGSGLIQAMNGSLFVIDSVSLDGHLHIPQYSDCQFRNSMNVLQGGLFQVGRTYASGYGLATALLAYDFELTGPGKTQIGYSGVLRNNDSIKQLTVSSDHTLELIESSMIGSSGNSDHSPMLDNQGTVMFDPIITGRSNQSNIYAQNGFVNSGIVNVMGSDEFEYGLYIWHNFSQTAGQLIVDGSLRFQSCGDVRISGGYLAGNGVVTCSGSSVVIGAAATVSPGTSIGKLTVNGSVKFEEGACYECEIGETQADLLDVNGLLTFDGGINIILSEDCIRTSHTDDIVLFEYGSFDGDVGLIAIVTPAEWTHGDIIDDGAGHIILQNLYTPGSGYPRSDLDCSGNVDILDLTILAQHWLQSTDNSIADIAPAIPDGIVNLCDFAVMSQEW